MSRVSRDIDHLVQLEFELWRAGRAAVAEPVPGGPPRQEPESSGALPKVVTPAGEAPFQNHVSKPACGDLAGLALSGGGIRSATFNLGVLQALARHGLLQHFHYLSTVSGGGYVGAFWTAWRQHRHAHHQASTSGLAYAQALSESAALFPMLDEGSGQEAPDVRHLREFSRFLSPRLGLFNFDTGRLVSALLNAMVPAIIASLAGTLLVLILLLGFPWWLLRFPAWVGAHMPSDQAGTLWARLAFPLAAYASMALLLWLCRQLMESVWRDGDETQDRSPLVSRLVLALAPAVWVTLLSVDHTASPVRLGAGMNALGIPWDPGNPLWRVAWYPPLAWFVTALLLAVVRPLLGPPHKTSTPTAVRTEIDRASSWLLFATGAWSAVAALWWGAHVLASTDNTLFRAVAGSGSALTVSGVLAWLLKKVSADRNQRSNTTAGLRISVQTLCYVAATVLIVGLMLLVLYASRHQSLAWLLLFVTVLVILALLTFDPNAFGLHAFYRERIARAYLGASNPTRTRGSDVLADDDMAMDARPWPPGPVHLVCCAANDLRPRNPMENLYRGAASAVLSPVGFSVGDHWYAWPPTREKDKPPFVPLLSSAVTASGAAFNSQMGAKSIELGPAASYLLGTLGLRLGLWIRHPRNLEDRRKFTWHTLPGLYFFSELLGYSRATANKVFLSDGGHFENLGLYELIRRHCRFIMISDCGADPARTFDDLGNAVRRVREDFGVEIRLDLSPLRSPEGRYSSQAMVAGEIVYPQGDTGTLLVFKPTLTGDEPPDVTNYAARRLAFPQETTGDQFYDAAQWEAYRQLGLFSVENALRRCEANTLSPDAAVLSKLFARAGKEWAARPTDFRDRARRIADRLQAIDEALSRSASTTLRSQVYPELRATTPPGAPAAAALLNETDLAESLLLVRKALVAFEEIFLTERLAQHFELPLYLGTTNYIARWAYAPLTQLWWPVIRAHCSEGFRRFMEERFNLAVPLGALTAIPMADAKGAIDLTQERPDRVDRESWRPNFAFVLQQPVSADAAPRLRVVVGGVMWREASPRVVEWDASDFVIAPALWGMKMGDQFLEQTVQRLGADGLADACQVRIAPRAHATYTDRNVGSYLPAFYRSHGFVDAIQGVTATGPAGAEGQGSLVLRREVR